VTVVYTASTNRINRHILGTFSILIDHPTFSDLFVERKTNSAEDCRGPESIL
jgi:hypothetical protein